MKRLLAIGLCLLVGLVMPAMSDVEDDYPKLTTTKKLLSLYDPTDEQMIQQWWLMSGNDTMPIQMFCSTKKYIRCFYLPEEKCSALFDSYPEDWSATALLFHFDKGLVQIQGHEDRLVYLGGTTFMLVATERWESIKYSANGGTIASFFKDKINGKIGLIHGYPGIADSYGVDSNIADCTIWK